MFRYKDIKPRNILVHHGNLLLADFGLSFDVSEAVGDATVNIVNGMTTRYCAPEVADRLQRIRMLTYGAFGVNGPIP